MPARRQRYTPNVPRTAAPTLNGRRAPTPAPRPPTGSYDPALDAQARAAQTGYGYLQQDTELANARAAQDYTFGLEDLTRTRDRGIFDLDRALGRGTEDYDRDVTMLNRSYQQLGRRQAEGARAAGVLSGGLALKAQAIRAENQAIDRQPLDTNFRRLGEDVTTGKTRLGEDFTTGSGRLAVDYGRGVFDRGTALTRAGQQNTQFGLDIDAQRLYQAGQSGWVPPPQPRAASNRFPIPGQGTGRQNPGGVTSPADWLQILRHRGLA